MQLSRAKLRRFLRTLVVEDWHMLSELALTKLTHPLFNVYYVVEFDLARANQLPAAPLPASVVISFFRGQEISPFTALLAESGLLAATVEQRMRRGDLVVLALTDDGELAGYAWTTFTDAWMPEVRATLPLRSDEVALFDGLVIPKWRGKGLYYPLTVAVFQYLSEQGYRRTLSWINALNTRSLKNQQRQGRRKIATIACAQVLGLVRMCNVLPDDGIALTRKKPPAMD
jgi:GNAT superfamily N-acetyltransferase